jgi:hypothetical protein
MITPLLTVVITEADENWLTVNTITWSGAGAR